MDNTWVIGPHPQLRMVFKGGFGTEEGGGKQQQVTDGRETDGRHEAWNVGLRERERALSFGCSLFHLFLLTIDLYLGWPDVLFYLSSFWDLKNALILRWWIFGFLWVLHKLVFRPLQVLERVSPSRFTFLRELWLSLVDHPLSEHWTPCRFH